MPSTLTFPSTEGFRNKLLSRNLSPYTVPGSYTPPSGQIVQETILRDQSVIDQDDSLIENPPKNLGPIYHGLYNLNEFGPDQGYGDTFSQSLPSSLASNLGEYDVTDASLPQQSLDGNTWPSYNSNAISEEDITSVNRWAFTTIQLAQIGNLLLTPKFEEYDTLNASLPEQSINGNTWPSYNSSAISEEDIPSVNKYSFDFVQLALIGNLLLTPIYSRYDITHASLPQQSLDGAGWPAYNANAISENTISSVNKYGLPSIILYQINDFILSPTYEQYNLNLASLPQQSLNGNNWPSYNSSAISEQDIPSVNRWSTPFVNLFSIGSVILPPKFVEYGVTNATLPDQSLTGAGWPSYNPGISEQDIPTTNKYSWSNSGGIQIYSVDTKQLVPTFKTYADPLGFVPSYYTPYQILLQDDPTGSDGSLSQDSFIAQLGAKTLKQEFKERIARQLIKNTVGRINLPNAANDPLMAVRVLQGKIPLIERDWVITRPGNILFRAADFAARLGGVYFPGSEIPGDYFTTDEHNLNLAGQIASAIGGNKNPQEGFLGKVFGRFLHQKSPSQLFLNNTGGGQKSQLYYSLGFNRYGPDYDKGIIGNLIDGAKNLLNSLLDKPTKGGYYVGSKEVDPGYVSGPAGKLPLNMFGVEVQTSVYGPNVLADLYEPGLEGIKFGFAGDSFYGNGGLSGGLTWSTPQSDLKVGYKVGQKGNQVSIDPEYNQTKSYLSLDLSTTDKNFREGSILWNTQKLVEAGEGDPAHVGNAINQISKVFNDGYKEITKGSKVMTYVSQGGVEVGKEYCRVFTKDTPYFTYADLQKRDGNHRGYSYSVLDKTYNLNIAPLKGTSASSSTNIRDGRVKKYMFSLENLAWRTSNRPGLTYLDLPECERGPNGGRVMWFPPYDISFNENVTPSFQGQDFLGRPEPVYTYKSTTRTGTLSWKIIVDHPSILNTIVEKEMKGKNKELVNNIVDSFFAGCKKYDIYELARKYNTVPISELFYMQQLITNPNITPEDVTEIGNTLPETKDQTTPPTPVPTNVDLSKWVGLGFYFDNDYPNPKTTQTTTNDSFASLYTNYTGKQGIYQSNATATDKPLVANFFKDVVIWSYSETEAFLNDLVKTFENNLTPDGKKTAAKVELVLDGSASAPNTKEYNVKLSSRRISSVQNYLQKWSGGKLDKYVKDKVLTIKDGASLGESPTGVSPKMKGGGTMGPFNCSDNDPATGKSSDIYSPNAMACRRVSVRSAKVTVDPGSTITPNNNTQTTPGSITPPGYKPSVPLPPTITTTQKLKDGISKKILRKLLSECDYFTLIEEQNPMVYDTIKEKVKYFDPAFHSMTPEGLNSRLTFLHQCTRPGDTIPVIGNDGKPKYTSSVNTSFGAPPVLVLRIGDFYNTKIIPTSLQITYDPLVLDINPEGIGVQPMLAKISLGFNFVGGSGLKEPIDKLQNALSFNYYANTEMYDERADWTDDSFKKIDEALIRALLDQTPVVGINNADNTLTNEGGTTIGVIQEKIESDLGTSGSITYQKIMDDSLLKGGQSYMETILNKCEQVTKDFNFQIYTAFSQGRKYVDGKTKEFTSPKDLKIYGKPDSIDSKITKLYDMIIKDIDNATSSTSDGLKYITNLYKADFPNSVIKKVKENLKNTVNKTKSSLLTSLTSADNEITKVQLELVRTLAKLDVVDTKTDGYIKSDQTAKIYNLTATTEVQSGGTYSDTYAELVGDYDPAVTSLFSFYTDLTSYPSSDGKKTYKLVDLEYTPDNLKVYEDGGFGTDPKNGDEEKRFYAVMSKTMLDNNLWEAFIKDVVPEDIANTPSNGDRLLTFTKSYYTTIKGSYKEEYDAEQKIVKSFKETANYKDKYSKWTPYPSGKVRKFTFNGYVAGTTEQSTRIQNLYKNGNSNDDTKTFNGKNKLN